LAAKRRGILLSSEHRAAPASPAVYLELVATDAQTAHLQVAAEPYAPRRPVSRTKSSPC